MFFSIIWRYFVSLFHTKKTHIMENMKENMKAANLDWSVRSENLTTTSGIPVEGKAIIRNDKDIILGTHGADYQPYQNEQLFELLYKITQSTGLDLHRGGHFGSGKKVYVQFKSSDLKIGQDIVHGFLTGINSFDGSTSLCFGASSLTVSCSNTFYGVMKGLQNKIKHTKNMLIRLDDVLKRIDESLVEEKVIFDHIKRFSEAKMSQKDIDMVIRTLFGIKKETSLSDYDSLSTRMQNQIASFKTAANQEIIGKGENLWGLFSGVTRYTTHNINSKKSSDEQKLFGLHGEREKQVFANLAQLVQ